MRFRTEQKRVFCVFRKCVIQTKKTPKQFKLIFVSFIL